MTTTAKRVLRGATSFSSVLGRDIRLTSDRDDMVFEGLFGVDATSTVINSAYPGAPSATIVGAPTMAADGITASEANFLDTNVADAPDLTIVVWGEPGAAAVNDAICATRQSQIVMYINAGGFLRSLVASNDGSFQETPGYAVAAPLADARMWAFTLAGLTNHVQKTYEFKGGALLNTNSFTATGKTRNLQANPIAFGSPRILGSFPGPLGLRAGAIWHGLRDATQLLDIHAESREVLAAVGVPT